MADPFEKLEDFIKKKKKKFDEDRNSN